MVEVVVPFFQRKCSFWPILDAALRRSCWHSKKVQVYPLLLVASFHDLQMTQLRSVNYICLVYKFKFLFLGNIYHRSIAILFGTVIFSSFWRLWKYFLTKTFSKPYICFLFIRKAAELVLEKLR